AFDRLNITEILTNYDLEEISKIMLTTCGKLSDNKKKTFLNKEITLVIKKINEFCNKVDKNQQERDLVDNNANTEELLEGITGEKTQDVIQQENFLRNYLFREVARQKIDEVSKKIAENNGLPISKKIQLCESAIKTIEELYSLDQKNTSTS